MTTPIVTYAADGKVGIVSLNRADKLNAISPELKKMLVERFHEADRDPATSVVILRAEGRSFCAGYDISPNPARASRRGNALAWHESLTDDVQLEMTPWEMKKPVIASVQGHCLGGGCELVMMCDLTIAADDAQLGEPKSDSNVGRRSYAVHHRSHAPASCSSSAIPSMRDGAAIRNGQPRGPRAELAARPEIRAAHGVDLAEALAATKLSINRGAESAGFRNAINSGLDILAALYAARTEVGMKFDEIREKKASAPPLRRRAAQFAD
jgi:hypothetical protein